jgi:hypothetical protein
MRKTERGIAVFPVLVVVLLVVILGLLVYFVLRTPAKVALETPYQAVLLDTGQVYYGKLEAAGTDYPVLRDVFYVQGTMNPETKQVTNILVRRGKEWHAPDRMILNARHIVLIEPVGTDSKVAQLIAEQKRQQ